MQLPKQKSYDVLFFCVMVRIIHSLYIVKRFFSTDVCSYSCTFEKKKKKKKNFYMVYYVILH